MPFEATTILNAIKTLFSFGGSLSKASVERRGRMADLFEKVAECLDETAKEIRAGDFPHGRCQELLNYSVDLPAMIKDEVGAGKAQEIGSALVDAHSVEKLFALREGLEGREELRKLDEAAGDLRALANTVRV